MLLTEETILLSSAIAPLNDVVIALVVEAQAVCSC